MIAFVTFYSDSFESRGQVLLNSIEKFYPDALLIPFKTEVDGNIGTYIDGLAKARLKEALALLKLDKSIKKLIILGADCELFSKLPELEDMLDYHDCILTPHVTKPLPNDGHSPSMAQLYQTGHANADIIGFRNTEGAIKILEWLCDQNMVDDKKNGIFYEQTWLSAVPFLFDMVGIIRHDGYNVGYWNIVDRLGKVDLRIAQYSGYVKGKPELMTKYQTRYKELPENVLEFFKRYDGLINQ